MSETAVKLYSFNLPGVTLAEALESAKCLLDGSAVALVYGLDACRFARVRKGDGHLEWPPGGSVPVGVYEARVFNKKAELRWVRDPSANDKGTAVLITEDQENDPRDGLKEAAPCLAGIPIGSTYLLWGTAKAASAGDWTTLFEHRVGALPVPVGGIPAGGRVQLEAVEYMAADDEYGNRAVKAERLCGLSEYAKQKP